MIKTILRDIRAVAGVTGVALLRKRDGFRAQIFPAAFTDEHATRLYDILAETYRHLRSFSRLQLTFERTTVHLFNRAEFLLLATLLPDADQRLFETVVKSKFAALDRALDSTPVIAKQGAIVAPSGTLSTGSPIDPILATLNRLSNRLIAECGRGRVSHGWRNARKAVGAVFPVLSLLAVDANGHWSIRKGQQPGANSRVSQALAELTELFITELGGLQPLAREALIAVIQRNEAELEKSGFLHYLKSYRPLRTPAERS